MSARTRLLKPLPASAAFPPALPTPSRSVSADRQLCGRSALALASRLQAMQARGEPQFLFNKFARVERLYERDPPLEGRMLDDVIA